MEPEKTKASIELDGLSPTALVCLLITNILDEELVPVAIIFTEEPCPKNGKELLRLWDYSIDRLSVEKIYEDEEKAQNEKRWIRGQIKTVG